MKYSTSQDPSPCWTPTVKSNKVSIKEVEEGSVVVVKDLAQLVVN